MKKRAAVLFPHAATCDIEFADLNNHNCTCGATEKRKQYKERMIEARNGHSRWSEQNYNTEDGNRRFQIMWGEHWVVATITRDQKLTLTCVGDSLKLGDLFSTLDKLHALATMIGRKRDET